MTIIIDLYSAITSELQRHWRRVMLVSVKC